MPSASWVSPSNGQNITSSSVRLEANASDNSSGVKEVRFSAKYNGAWNGLAVDTSAPYVFDWNMCNYGVLDGDVELGLEATDNAGNKYVYSQDPANGGNIHVNKAYTCNTPPPQGCAAPTLISPSDGETLGSRTITFSWNPVSGCTFNGYTFRVCTSSDVETLSNCFIDSGEGSTQRTETITDHDNMDLWWGVKAANASAGSSWATRRFRINPAAANGQWNASYFNTRTCWDDHNNCNGQTYNETLYVPGGGTLIDKNYGSSSPGGGIGPDNWTGRYEGTFNFATGNYVFYADHDDGLKLNIWNYGEHTKDSSGTNSVICNGNGGYFLSGDMPIRLYLREDGGDAKIKLHWSTDTSVCGSGSGGGVTGGSWSADYYNTRTCWDDHANCNGQTYHDSPSFPGADTLIDKNWGQGSPGGGIGPDNWTGRFFNTFNFQSAKYVFYADHDDGLKLQFGSYGEHTKDSSGSNSMICNGADGYQLSGNQQIKLYLREDGGDARVKLRWNTDTTACLPVPAAPTGVGASDGAYTDHVRLTWNAASYANVYEVWRSSTNDSGAASVINNYVTATSYDDAYIVAGQTYYYWIKAKNNKGTSGFSSSDSGFASVPPPEAPTGVSASDGDYPDNVQITWLAVPGASSYEVWRNTDDNSDTATQIAGMVNGTNYTDTTVEVGQIYYYWVKAGNVSGAGVFSVSDAGYAYVPAPAAPTGVTASDGVYIDHVQVSWLAAPGVSSYDIWRSTSDNPESAGQIAQGVNGTAYDDIGTTSDQTYFYWVKARSAGGASSFSGPDSGYSKAPAPQAVADLAIAQFTPGSDLTWSHTNPEVTHYQVYRSENPYFTPGQGDSIKLEPDIAAPKSGSAVSYPGAGLWPGVGAPNFYAVRAVSQYGAVSAVSNRVGSFTFSLQSEGDPAPGVLLNGGFEDGDTTPSSWVADEWAYGRATFTWDGEQRRSGRRSIKITSSEENDARWIQAITVEPNTDYRLSGCIKTENVAHRSDGTDAGANLSLMGGWNRSAGVFDTSDWTCTSVVFNTGDEAEVIIAARLGFYAGTTTGVAWFDDLRLEKLDAIQSISIDIDADDQDGMEEPYFSISGDGNGNNWVGVSSSVMTGWVFPTVAIPRGATITDAHILTYGYGNSGSSTTRIYGFAEDSAPVFAADGSNKPSTRPITQAYVDWPETWMFVWQGIETPNFANVIQEVVNRTGWVSGNAIGIRANIPSGMGTNWCSVDYAAESERTTLYVTYSVP